MHPPFQIVDAMTSETFLLFTVACLALVAAPGPDNLLAVARGLSQGRLAACVSALASGCGILIHVVAATLGLTTLLTASATVFLTVKGVGAAYLIWLGYTAIRSRSLISLEKRQAVPLRTVFRTGFLSAALNPKVGIFLIAFVPQFIDAGADAAALDFALLAGWFAVLTAVGFALMGISASRIARWLSARPRVVSGLNVGAGLVFVATGLSVALAKRQ